MKKENAYIMNLESCYIYKDIMEDKETTSKNRDLAKLFSATIPYSLESIRISNIFPDSFYTVNNKQYTKKIINLTFDKNYTTWDENEEWEDKNGNKRKGKRRIAASKKKIRKYIYEKGFIMDGFRYIFYKRGAGKAKNGFALYIQEDMKETLINRSRLGLKFEIDELLDLTSLLAYESLISSGIDFTIELDPKTEILIIEDIYGEKFKSLASVTKEEEKVITTNNEIVDIQNCLTDGQGLLDESLFKKYDKADKGFMLLRTDFLKCCGFNTKLQEWFIENGITTIKDMYGNDYDSSKIKLITTPNSLKILKFAYKIGKSTDKECFEYWKENIDNIFGVVKCDKEGNYGNYNRTTYQLLNSIPNLTYDELVVITKLERDYVMLLKNDFAVFRNYLGCDAKLSLKLEKNMDKDDVSLYENTELMNALLLVNSDIQYTKTFKKLKSDLISNYISHLKEGKIRLKDTKYVTIVSNPYEMLLACIGQYKDKSIMNGREVWCQYYNEGQEFCVSRNPHINAGNVMCSKNVNHDEYKWFNFTDNIMAVNFFDNDMPDRLQGEDTDSDTNLVIPHPILVEKAKYCEKNFATPINKVKGSSKPRKNNMIELQKLDVILSNNYIGRIVNTSQIINSYLNDAISKGESEDTINELYQASSRLSSMSQIEIDKSKKVFDNISMSKELNRIRQIPYIRYKEEKDKYDETASKMIVPNFFSMVSECNDYRIFEKFNTPLDILQDVIVFKGAKRVKGEKHLEFIDLLVKLKEVEGKCSYSSVDAIYKIIECCGKKINGLRIKTCKLNDKAKKTVEKKSKHEAIKLLKDLKPNDYTMLYILKQCFGDKSGLDFKKYGMLTLNLLYSSKKLQLLKCFKKDNMDMDEVLIKINDECDYEIFGGNYQKIIRKDMN
ncbi:hypothetical protein G9F71_008355 [Clostridium sp. FP2]|uniref:RNA dependent RNA polymerase n=1 Tax=Clostridium sp. FP2 TaxID=2724481 RepID=UPI0013E987DB|nr:hypothetical protein [Clostridium sp. FP2]MBZ9622863.1 hypothetical protein [Clostridium sp. FP2]